MRLRGLPTARTVAIALSLAFAGPPLAQAGSILVYFEGNGGNGNPRGLYNFDVSTGVSELRVGIPAGPTFGAMAIRPSDGVVFATANFDLSKSALYTLNINSGESSFVGFLPGSDSNQIYSIAFRPATNALYGVTLNGGGLYAIDPDTAGLTFIGSTKADAGIEFAPDGTLFGIGNIDGRLYSINPEDGSEQLIGGGGSPSIFDAAFTSHGELFMANYTGEIYRVNTTTGQRTVAGVTGMGFQLYGVIAIPSQLLIGDANWDCAVGAADYAIWAAQFGQSGTSLAADFDGNGSVGAGDYALWAANFGNTSAPGATSVPEPTSLMLAAGGIAAALATLLRRRA